MPYVRSRYYREEEKPAGYRRVEAGFGLLEKNTLFHQLDGYITAKPSHLNAKGSLACVTKDGNIYVNMRANLSPEQWCYVMAHNLLHLAFGHFDKASIPSDCEFVPALWNKACDIYITRFLYDIRLGEPICADPAEAYPIKLNSEQKIYEYLLKHQDNGAQICGTNSEKLKDMIGVERPIVYKKGERNAYAEKFSYAVTHSIKSALCDAGGYDLKTKKNTVISRAAEWFLSHYPLLGGLAAAFKIVEDIEMCHRYEIHIAAVDAEQGIIYANPSCGFSEEEWIFVLAHEYLHAGLQHQKRCNGRDFFLWNIACDYVINDWLHEMEIGRMPPDGLLYDETLHNKSAESIYDLIVKETRKYKKLNTFRGFGRGDMFNGNRPHFTGRENGVSLDELLKNALREGLDYHQEHNRGFLPAGLVQEIRALAMPAIPWDAALAKWFDVQFPPLEKHRTYYNDRVTAIEKAEEEARKKAEEEAKKKAEEEAKKKAEEEAAAKAAQEEAERKAAEEAAEQSSGSSSSGSSYYDDSNDYSYSSGNSSSGYSDSGSGSDSSGGLSSSDGSSSSGSGIPSGANYGWAEDGAGRVENYYDPSTGDTWDANGNYSGNMNDWLWD